MANGLYSVYVGNLNLLTTKVELEGLFSKFGTPKRLYIADKGRSSEFTYGFVRFVLKESAFSAVLEMNGHIHKGRQLLVELSSDNNGIKDLRNEINERNGINERSTSVVSKSILDQDTKDVQRIIRLKVAVRDHNATPGLQPIDSNGLMAAINKMKNKLPQTKTDQFKFSSEPLLQELADPLVDKTRRLVLDGKTSPLAHCKEISEMGVPWFTIMNLPPPPAQTSTTPLTDTAPALVSDSSSLDSVLPSVSTSVLAHADSASSMSILPHYTPSEPGQFCSAQSPSTSEVESKLMDGMLSDSSSRRGPRACSRSAAKSSPIRMPKQAPLVATKSVISKAQEPLTIPDLLVNHQSTAVMSQSPVTSGYSSSDDLTLNSSTSPTKTSKSVDLLDSQSSSVSLSSTSQKTLENPPNLEFLDGDQCPALEPINPSPPSVKRGVRSVRKQDQRFVKRGFADYHVYNTSPLPYLNSYSQRPQSCHQYPRYSPLNVHRYCQRSPSSVHQCPRYSPRYSPPQQNFSSQRYPYQQPPQSSMWQQRQYDQGQQYSMQDDCSEQPRYTSPPPPYERYPSHHNAAPQTKLPSQPQSLAPPPVAVVLKQRTQATTAVRGGNGRGLKLLAALRNE